MVRFEFRKDLFGTWVENGFEKKGKKTKEMRLNSIAMTPNTNSLRYEWGQVPWQQGWRKEKS